MFQAGGGRTGECRVNINKNEERGDCFEEHDKFNETANGTWKSARIHQGRLDEQGMEKPADKGR